MTNIDQPAIFHSFFPYFFMGPKSGPREPPYSNDVQVTHTLVVLINEFLLWAIQRAVLDRDMAIPSGKHTKKLWKITIFKR